MEDIFKQQAQWLNSWQEQQEKLTKQYASWGENLTQGIPGVGNQQIPTNFEEILKGQQELLEQFTSFGGDLQQNLQKLWGDKLPKELLGHFNFSFLQEFYKSWLGNMNFPAGMHNPFAGGQNWTDPSKFLNNFMKQENPFTSMFSSRNLSDEVQKLFGMLQGTGLPGGDIYGQMFTSFQGFFNQLSDTNSSQGFEKLLESFNSWKEQLDSHLLAPKVGINRELNQDVSKVVSLSFDYFEAVAKMAKIVEETSRKSGNRFQSKLVERSLNNEPPHKFTDFCNLWTKENEAVFLDVFATEEFAKTQGEFTSAGLRLKIQLNQLAERALDQTPIALKRDVDLAAGEITQLKRELRKSKKQQQEFVKAAKEVQEAAASSEQRLQQMETELKAVQKESEKAAKESASINEQRLQQLEKELEKVQALAKKADVSAKAAVQLNKPAKKAAPAAKNPTTPRSTKKTSSAKKPAAKPAK